MTPEVERWLRHPDATRALEELRSTMIPVATMVAGDPYATHYRLGMRELFEQIQEKIDHVRRATEDFDPSTPPTRR